MVVDVWFPISGSVLPADHGFQLYSALCRELPVLHEVQTWGLHPVKGRPAEARQIVLERSQFGIRLSHELLPEVLPLTGRRPAGGGESIGIGVPRVMQLVPAARLVAHIVTARNALDADLLLGFLRRSLQDAGRTATLEVGRRRVLRIHEKMVVGYAVAASDLDVETSIWLQETGMGGEDALDVVCFAQVT